MLKTPTVLFLVLDEIFTSTSHLYFNMAHRLSLWNFTACEYHDQRQHLKQEYDIIC